ncbi:NifB/NifX family molybdenum-iron cluster-binding protein [Thermococcus piezophilus]|uniref:Dinitrogenase iron-molybdenum cofactor n=1 Tax=Thermococcus piezophilus TaxID=1712654 RepID=A0A172WI22_9EURY|nr:NifB/NifX family molybdenum-iron cluster-binding protein [Thermococcus piezophilus]ANF22956.1 dinitrogenase iron-molybdenum cofactor [Thermococcus piezophilus]
MRIAVPIKDNRGLESEVCEHFGRARYVVFIDVEDGTVKGSEVIEVPFKEHESGDLPAFIKEHGGEVVLAYGMGRRAIAYFNTMGVQVITGVSGKVRDVLEGLAKGTLKTDPDWRSKGDFGRHEF